MSTERLIAAVDALLASVSMSPKQKARIRNREGHSSLIPVMPGLLTELQEARHELHAVVDAADEGTPS